VIVLRAKPRRVTMEGSRDNRGPSEMWNLVVTENNCAFIALAYTKCLGPAGERDLGIGTVGWSPTHLQNTNMRGRSLLQPSSSVSKIALGGHEFNYLRLVIMCLTPFV